MNVSLRSASQYTYTCVKIAVSYSYENDSIMARWIKLIRIQKIRCVGDEIQDTCNVCSSLKRY